MEPIDSPTTGRLRAIARRTAASAADILLGLNLLAWLGFVARDGVLLLALLFYIPLPLVGFLSIVLDLVCRGRSLRAPRWTLATIGLLAVIGSTIALTGRGPGAAPPPGTRTEGEIRLVHWNVLWGGWSPTDASWDSITETILQQRPDVVVLSEAGTAARIGELERKLGMGWSGTRVAQLPPKLNRYKLAVLSRWPVRRGPMVRIRNGTAIEVEVQCPEHPLRLLAIDGVSTISTLRAPMLHDITKACRRASAAGRPYDVVVGDFNALGRSRGFDELRSAGYGLASDASRGWRTTWPVPLPVYDIDHVWIRTGNFVLSCSFFANIMSDHRGQTVRLAFPAAAR